MYSCSPATSTISFSKIFVLMSNVGAVARKDVARRADAFDRLDAAAARVRGTDAVIGVAMDAIVVA